MKILRALRPGRSVQELLGIRGFSRYGLLTNCGELLFYQVAPTNISVLSSPNISLKIHHLTMVLTAIPEIEIVCTDASECFDDNKAFLHQRLQEERSHPVRELLRKDLDFLDHIQMELATARQFLFIARLKNATDKQTFDAANRMEKIIAGQGFEVHRMNENQLKRFLALCFDASINGERLPDVDGAHFLEQEAAVCFGQRH